MPPSTASVFNHQDQSWQEDLDQNINEVHCTCLTLQIYMPLASRRTEAIALFFRHRCCLQKSENCERPLATICGSMRHGKDENNHNRFARVSWVVFFSSRTCAMIHFTILVFFCFKGSAQDQPFPLFYVELAAL